MVTEKHFRIYFLMQCVQYGHNSMMKIKLLDNNIKEDLHDPVIRKDNM
jgi:hypothetical protein